MVYLEIFDTQGKKEKEVYISFGKMHEKN